MLVSCLRRLSMVGTTCASALVFVLSAGVLGDVVKGGGGGSASQGERAESSLMQFRQTPDGWFDMQSKSGNYTGMEWVTACEECLAQNDLVVRHTWCPKDRICHTDSTKNPCPIPIDTLSLCWAQRAPHNALRYMSGKLEAEVMVVRQAITSQRKPAQPFPTNPACISALYDLHTGEAHDNAAWGCPTTGNVVVLVGNWGSGIAEADAVAKLVELEKPNLTVHLGGVFVAGTDEEYDTNVCGKPPNGFQTGVSFPKGFQRTILHGSVHDMTDGYSGLTNKGFEFSEQGSTYSCFQSDSWRLVSIDTGYLSREQSPDGRRNVFAPETEAPTPDAVFVWLRDTVKLGDPADKRGIVVLANHHPHSDFGREYLGLAKQLQELLPEGKTILWFASRETSWAQYRMFRPPGMTYNIHLRTIGNGGYPISIPRPGRKGHLLKYDDRVYQSLWLGNPDEYKEVGFNGYTKVVVSDNQLKVTHLSTKCKPCGCGSGYSLREREVLAEETFTVDMQTGGITVAESIIGEGVKA